MRYDRPDRIRLDEVDVVFAGGLPLVDQRKQHEQVGIAEFYKAEIESQAELLIRNTFSSMQGYVDTPQTLLHSLMLRDNQTIGQIAASLHVDPRSLHYEIEVLTESGVISAADIDSALPRFSLADS